MTNGQVYVSLLSHGCPAPRNATGQEIESRDAGTTRNAEFAVGELEMGIVKRRAGQKH